VYNFLFFLGKAELAIAGKQGDVFGFRMLVLEAVVGKKLDLTEGEGETMGLLGFAWSTHRGERRRRWWKRRWGTCSNVGNFKVLGEGYFRAFGLKESCVVYVTQFSST
jgi:hypothetical protein